LLLAWGHLYSATARSLYSKEVQKLAQVAGGCAVIGYLVSLVPRHHPWAAAAFGAVIWATLAMYRGLYRAWLRRLHRRGKCLRTVVLVARPGDAGVILTHLSNFPEIGYRVASVVNPAPLARVADETSPGVVGQIIGLARGLDAAALLVAPGALSSREMAQLTRSALTLGFAVHLWGGVPGVDPRRIRPLPLEHHAAFAVEPRRMAASALFVKRAMDVVLSSLLLFVTAPLLLVAALWVKLEDGGPMIFRQTRIGKDGRPFTVFKFRSMVVNAESRLAELRHRNERLDSPLFKLEADPRVTRAGRFLRATSIDELPQLFNVLRGHMSLVGPRPALAEEVAAFDEELLRRLRVTPGVTGLWQVKGRESPSFDMYRDLDIFYVENWSLSMDVALLAATVTSVLGRAVHHLRPAQPAEAEAVPVELHPGSAERELLETDLRPRRVATGVAEGS
jgi:exopolysaccharide biosynthesis polyprenyl glycosylphosphotransferase